jgi:adenylate cyclase
MALAMLPKDAVSAFRRRLPLRIGIATGPVMAGVIGSQKFSYDVWGDQNLAARLDRAACPTRTASPNTHLALAGAFECECRGDRD